MPISTTCKDHGTYDALLPPKCRVLGAGDVLTACTACTEKWQAAQRARVNEVNAGRLNKKGKGDPRDYQGPGGTFVLHE